MATDAIKTIREALDTIDRRCHTAASGRGARAALASLEAELATLRSRLAPADSPPGDEELPLRPALAWFAQAMERKLRANDHKRGWSRDSVWSLLARVQDELNELDSAATASHGARDPLRVLDEAADVANMAMMVADVSQPDVRANGWDRPAEAHLRSQARDAEGGES